MALLVDLQARRAAYVAAEAAILQGQEYRISDGMINRLMRRADLDVVRATIADLDRQIAAQSMPRRRYHIR